MHLLEVHDAVQGFTLENIVDSSFSNIYQVAFTACPCFLAYYLFKNNIENILSLAYALWRVLRAIRWNFVPLGNKYPEHTPCGECSGQWQEVSRAYAFWRVLWAPDNIIALQAFVLGNGISKG
jgi:hypothetical protein